MKDQDKKIMSEIRELELLEEEVSNTPHLICQPITCFSNHTCTPWGTKQ
jgi:hypothetical protein